MNFTQNLTDYWFTIEPYVFIGITDKCVLLYNTLDKVTIKSEKVEVIELLREMLQDENCGVVLLDNERYEQKNINVFIRELREKYMGDIIDVTLSKGKPIQLHPYFNYINRPEIHKIVDPSPYDNVLENLSEISIYVDATTNLKKLIPFLMSISGIPKFNIVGNLGEVTNYIELLSFFNQQSSAKYLWCPYENVILLQPAFENNFLYGISVHFPIDIEQWNSSMEILLNQTLPFEFIFEVSSDDDCLKAEQLIGWFGIQKYQLKPIYTGDNICFFEKNVFLKEKDILSSSMTIKKIFAHKSMNIYDFGKISIMPNGDAYANIYHPSLGNIFTNSIDEIVYKEKEEGKSWFRIRNQEPCSKCVYQWLCPPPSDYEIIIGRPNLCHVKN